MPIVNPIDIKAIFERAAGHKLPEPKRAISFVPSEKPPIAGNLNTK